jgi:hypothetical protein
MRFNEFITESSKICPQCGMKGCTCKPGKCNCKPKPGYPKQVDEAANPAQQAAIAIAKKKKQGVAEGLHPMVVDDVKKLATLNPTDRYSAYSNIRGYFKDNPELSKMASDLMGGYYEADMLRGKYKTDAAKAKYAELEPMNQAFIKQALGQEQGVAEGENWSKHNHKRVGGMSDKSVKSYRRSHPGSKIQTAVTKKPSKIKKGSKDAKRRASFCARMRGMKKHRTSAKTARDPNSNINKSLRRWHCESIEQMQELVMLAEQFIRNHKK